MVDSAKTIPRRPYFSYLSSALSRSKPLDHDSVMDTPLNRNLTQIDLLFYGAGAMLGNSIYGVVAIVSNEYAGPATFLSFLLAGFVAFLNGLCYSELSANIPRAGSAYMYTYVISGEFLAFLTGWLMMLEYAVSACCAAVSASYNLDLIANRTISTYILHNVGEMKGSSFLNSYPNFPACAFVMIALIVLSTGNTSFTWINIFLQFVTLSAIAISTIFMFCHFNPENYISETHHAFLPFGVGGLLSGAGIAFNAFIGFDAISVAGEEVKNPRKTIPMAISISVLFVIIVCVIHSISFIGYASWWSIDPQLGLINVFFNPPVDWMKYIVGVGAVLAALFSTMCCTFAIPRIAYSMASDGLLFAPMAWIHPKSKVPLLPLLLFGMIIAVAAALFNYDSLVSFLSVGTLITYVIVGCDLLVLRFMRSELYLQKDTDEVGLLYHQFRKLKFIDCKARGFVPCLALLCFIILSGVIIIFGVDASKHIADASGWAIVILVLLVLALIVCVVIIALHRPYESADAETFQVPLVPYIPLISIFFNIALIIKLPVLTWVRVVVWLLIGLMVYFFYGIRHSKLATEVLIMAPCDYYELPGSNRRDRKTFSVSESPKKINDTKFHDDEKKPIMQKD